MDLSKLNIRVHSFSEAGVTFKARHLSKQSKASKLSAVPDTQRIKLPAQWLHCKHMRLERWSLGLDQQKTGKSCCSYHGLEGMTQ